MNIKTDIQDSRITVSFVVFPDSEFKMHEVRERLLSEIHYRIQASGSKIDDGYIRTGTVLERVFGEDVFCVSAAWIKDEIEQKK